MYRGNCSTMDKVFKNKTPFAIVVCLLGMKGLDIKGRDWFMIGDEKDKSQLKKLGFTFIRNNNEPKILEKTLTEKEQDWFKEHKEHFKLEFESKNNRIYVPKYVENFKQYILKKDGN